VAAFVFLEIANSVRYGSFVIAAWRAKETESGPREVLGNNRRQSQQSRLELGLRLSD
jgi:hypothetical protein